MIPKRYLCDKWDEVKQTNLLALELRFIADYMYVGMYVSRHFQGTIQRLSAFWTNFYFVLGMSGGVCVRVLTFTLLFILFVLDAWEFSADEHFFV